MTEQQAAEIITHLKGLLAIAIFWSVLGILFIISVTAPRIK
jgi:hypothetical protein